MREAVAVLVVALLACKGEQPKGEPSPGAPSASAQAAPATKAGTAHVKNRKPEITVTIRELLKDYAGNELAADAKYKGKLVGVAGYVDQIKKDITDEPYVTLGTGKEFEIPQAQLYFGEGAEGVLATLKKGQTAVVVCKCEGLMVNVLLKECTLALNKDGGLIGSAGQ
jgi:hypothetical protein